MQSRRTKEIDSRATLLSDLKDVKASADPRKRAIDLASSFKGQNDPSGKAQGRANFLMEVVREMDTDYSLLDKQLATAQAVLAGMTVHSNLKEVQ